MKLVGFYTLLILLLVRNLSVSHAYASEKLPEYTIKAGYLYHFAQLTEWKQRKIENVFNFCIYGDTKILSALIDWQSKPVRGLQANVQQIKSASEVKACHILFVAGVDRIDFSVIRAEAIQQSVLTVTDDPILAAEQVSVFLRPQGKQLVFELDTEVASRSNLVFSSRLLRLVR